ncbi:MAG TPA: aminotransferase class I/II-fold pyridoxal phosphate-dependent enzyme [Gemmatimonadaceae bacterium]|nr:aminotransferase class I/II-fold pyridoxal phosphate-dependent enzyme [Gemmatimonadaceae bacterium]
MATRFDPTHLTAASRRSAEIEPEFNSKISEHDYSNFYYSSSDDVFGIFPHFDEWYYGHAKNSGYYLFGQPMSTPPTAQIRLEEQLGRRPVELLNLASYNYLGLSYHPEVIAAAHAAIDKYGLGAAGSPLLSGMMDVQMELENELAAFKRKGSAIVFPTGYSTNVGLISALMRPGDWVIMDQNCHASIVDGAILAKSNARFFRHNQPEDLEKKLRDTSGRRLVVVEGVYSMDGDVVRLPEIVEVAKKYGARILIDEAHSGFVYGPNGRGVAEHFGLEDEIDLHVGTFSKALGGMGGYVAGSAELYMYLKGFARSRVFSCALSPVVTAGVLAALKIVQREPELRDKLWKNVAYMRGLLAEAGVDVGESTSQVIPVMIRNDRRVFAIAHEIQRAGLYLQPIIFPAVAKNRSRFRISISSQHTFEQLSRAANILIDVLRAEGVLRIEGAA